METLQQAKRHTQFRRRRPKQQQHQAASAEQKEGAMTVTAKAKTKFSSRNLNAVYKAPLVKAADNAGYHSGSRMLVLKSSNSAGGRSSILAAKSLVVAAPAPINTPSLRKENNGQDVHVNLVPTGKVGWGTSPKAANNNNNSSELEREPRAAEHSATPFSSRGESSRQAWGSNLASSSQRHGEFAQHHADDSNRAAFSTRNGLIRGPSGGVFSGASNTGRWGDDAVEQDIARSDRMRAMQQERDFPQLKENYADEAHHFHASDSQRFSENEASNTSSYGYDQRPQRYDSYEFERRGGGINFHEDRFRSRGYGGFDRSRAPPANAYGSNSSSDHSYYHPSDSRYDNASHQPMPLSSSYRQYPGSNDRYYGSYRREHHPTDRYYAEDHHGAGRCQGRSYQIERRGCDAMPEPHRSSELPPRPDDNNQSPMGESDNQESVPSSPEPAIQQLPSNDASHVNSSDTRTAEPQAKDDRGNDQDAAPEPVFTSVWKKVDADIAQNCSSGVRPHSSDRLPPKMSSSVHQPFTSGRPFSVRGEMSTSSSSNRPSSVVPSAYSAPAVVPVRILRRDGPKMLFDPKTGTMVNAEEKSSSRSQRLPSTASSSTVASETETSGSSRDSMPVADPKPKTDVKSEENTGAAKRIAHAKPDETKNRSRSEEKAPASSKQVREEAESPPGVGDHTQRVSTRAPVQPPVKSLRGKKKRDLESTNSKKAVVKSKTKKYVLAYRPVSKPASGATPASAQTAPAPLPMKKFNELFATSKPAEIVEPATELAASRAVKSTTRKHAKKHLVETQLTKTSTRAKFARRKVEITSEKRLRKPLSKAHRVSRKRLESSASEGSSTHSSNNSTDALRIVVESPTSLTLSREDTPRVHHSKIRKGIDVDILKQIPEGGGVVVLTVAQQGIEFLPDDSDSKFETVRSRRAVLLEKKQLREAAAAPKSTRLRRTGVKQQITASGIVMAAPSRTAKRTLVVGTRASAHKPVGGLPASSSNESQPKQPPVKSQEEPSKRSPVSPTVQASKSEQPKSNMRNRASSLPDRAQKHSSERLKTRPDQPATARASTPPKAKQNLKTAVKKRVYRELPTKKEDAAPVQGSEVSAKPPSNQVGAAAGDSRLSGEEKPQDALTRSKKPGSKKEKPQKASSLQPAPTNANEVEVTAKATENVNSPQSTARKVRTQRSSSAVVPVKMKYVPKVPAKAASTSDMVKSEVAKPEVVRLPEEVTTSNSARKVDGDDRRNPRKAKHNSKLADIKATSPAPTAAAPVTKVKQAKRLSCPPVDFKARTFAPTPGEMPAAAQIQTCRAKEDEAPRKVSTTTPAKIRNGDAKPKPAERSPPLRKSLSKSGAGVPAPLSVAKSYRQVYVVKSSSSTSSPVPSSSAA